MKVLKWLVFAVFLFPHFVYAKTDMSTSELLELAESGDPGAQFRLSYRYLMDNEYPYNPEEGLKWLKLSAENGDRRAQHNLGSVYFEGHIVTKNIDEAIIWYTKAAQNGYSFSQYELIELYMDESPKEAYAWAYVLSRDDAAGWSKHGRELLEKINNKIDPEDVKSAEILGKKYYGLYAKGKQ